MTKEELIEKLWMQDTKIKLDKYKSIVEPLIIEYTKSLTFVDMVNIPCNKPPVSNNGKCKDSAKITNGTGGKYSPEFEKIWQQERKFLGEAAGNKKNTYEAYKQFKRKKYYLIINDCYEAIRHDFFKRNIEITHFNIVYEIRALQLPRYIKRRDERNQSVKLLQYWLGNGKSGNGWATHPESIYSEPKGKTFFTPEMERKFEEMEKTAPK